MAMLLIERRSKEAAERANRKDFASPHDHAVDLRDNALVTQIALRSVQKISSLVGAKAGFPEHPVSLAKRDVEFAACHVTLNWRQAAVSYLKSAIGE
jgi:hypothetical protein